MTDECGSYSHAVRLLLMCAVDNIRSASFPRYLKFLRPLAFPFSAHSPAHPQLSSAILIHERQGPEAFRQSLVR